MGNSFFRFKQFEIDQTGCAMKVGTDGVLIGAWCWATGVDRALDIGTGTGLIALMIAQRGIRRIDAVEIEHSAFERAGLNVVRSRWKDRISLFHANFSDFARMTTGMKYDLIVSNPPYFERSLLSENFSRNIARHDVSLNYDTLFARSVGILRDSGRISLITPADMDVVLDEHARKYGLFPIRKTYVKGREGLPVKRLMSEWGKIAPESVAIDVLTIEEERHRYTSEYVALTRDFYLNM